MAYSPISLGEIYSQANHLKAQDQYSQLAGMQIQQGQRQQQQQGALDSLAANPDASLGDYAKGAGMQGVQAYGQRQQIQSQMDAQTAQAAYRAANDVAIAPDPIAATKASPEGQKYIAELEKQGIKFDDLSKDEVRQHAIRVSQHLLSVLVPVEEQYKQGQENYRAGISKPTDDQQEYAAAVQSGTFKGSLQDWILQQKRAGANTVSTVVNTEKGLYGTIAEERGKSISALYDAAQSAPEAIARVGRIRQLLDKNPYTGTGADYKLALGKGARALGFNYAEGDAANTEALATEMARSTLDNIKSSGLAGSQGLTEGERKFLQDAVAGRITLEPTTIRRLADLNERSARLTLKRWGSTAKSLKPEQLQTLGMSDIGQPAPPNTNAPVAGKLIQNPDGSYNYNP